MRNALLPPRLSVSVVRAVETATQRSSDVRKLATATDMCGSHTEGRGWGGTEKRGGVLRNGLTFCGRGGSVGVLVLVLRAGGFARCRSYCNVLLQVTDAAGRAAALRSLLLLLGYPFPKVRRYAAEQLYTTVAVAGADLTRVPTDAQAAEALLTETVWDGGVDAARKARDQLRSLLF